MASIFFVVKVGVLSDSDVQIDPDFDIFFGSEAKVRILNKNNPANSLAMHTIAQRADVARSNQTVANAERRSRENGFMALKILTNSTESPLLTNDQVIDGLTRRDVLKQRLGVSLLKLTSSTKFSQTMDLNQVVVIGLREVYTNRLEELLSYLTSEVGKNTIEVNHSVIMSFIDSFQALNPNEPGRKVPPRPQMNAVGISKFKPREMGVPYREEELANIRQLQTQVPGSHGSGGYGAPQVPQTMYHQKTGNMRESSAPSTYPKSMYREQQQQQQASMSHYSHPPPSHVPQQQHYTQSSMYAQQPVYQDHQTQSNAYYGHSVYMGGYESPRPSPLMNAAYMTSTSMNMGIPIQMPMIQSNPVPYGVDLLPLDIHGNYAYVSSGLHSPRHSPRYPQEFAVIYSPPTSPGSNGWSNRKKFTGGKGGRGDSNRSRASSGDSLSMDNVYNVLKDIGIDKVDSSRNSIGSSESLPVSPDPSPRESLVAKDR